MWNEGKNPFAAVVNGKKRICRQTCTDAFNFVLFIHFIRSTATNTTTLTQKFHCIWYTNLANIAFHLYNARIHTIHFHSRIYDMFFFGGYPIFSRPRMSVLIFIIFSMRSNHFYAHSHWIFSSINCAVQPAITFSFFIVRFFLSRQFFLSETQVIFHVCALFFRYFLYVCLFVRSFIRFCFISHRFCCCVVIRVIQVWARVRERTHTRSFNVYHSTIFSFWCI